MPLPPLTPDIRRDIEEVVATGVYTYLLEYTRGIFPDHLEPQAQDCVANGLALALGRYEAATGVPIAQAVALNLLDKEEGK